MKKLFAFLACFCLSSALAYSQSAPALTAPATPAWELSAGYQFLRVFTPCCSSFGGFNTSIQENKSSWFGGILDVAATFHNPAGLRQTIVTVTAGPQFTYRKSSKVQPFVRLLIGGANERTTSAPIKFTETSVAFGGGGGADLRLLPKLYLRAKVDYLRGSYSSQTQEHFQTGVGIVYRFGSL